MIFKELYKGRGIYWHGKAGYGDETNPLYRTMKECKQAIDRLEQEEEARKSPELKYWDTLSSNERDKWRRACITTELSAAELAYIAMKGTQA